MRVSAWPVGVAKWLLAGWAKHRWQDASQQRAEQSAKDSVTSSTLAADDLYRVGTTLLDVSRGVSRLLRSGLSHEDMNAERRQHSLPCLLDDSLVSTARYLAPVSSRTMSSKPAAARRALVSDGGTK